MAHFFAKMIDMAKTPEQVNKEVDERSSKPSTQAIADSIPKYPYGLCISLENEQLEKFEIDGDCEVGDMIHFCALARVTSVSSREKEKDKDHRIELQITHMAIESEDEENEESVRGEKAERRYGEKKEAA